MAAWAPDLVTDADRADITVSMANARDIHDATIKMIDVMIPYLLKDADTRDLRVWGFIYVILVFMRSLKTRQHLLEWFGFAFHAELLAPFINMLLCEDETRGSRALESTSQLVKLCSLLNQEEKLGDYGLTTEDNIKKYHQSQEERRKVEGASNTVTGEDATATKDVPAEDGTVTPEEDAAFKADNAHQMYANVLPEDYLLRGHFFAREDKSDDKLLEDSTKDAVPPAPKATPTAVQPTEKPAEEPAEEPAEVSSSVCCTAGSRTNSDSSSEAQVLTDSESEGDVEEEWTKTEAEAQQQDAKTQEEEAEDVQQEEEQKKREAEEAREAEERKKREAKEAREAEERKREAKLRDPHLFPRQWFAKTKHNYDERQIRQNRVQDPESCNDRSVQIVCLACQLTGAFFTHLIDNKGRYRISVPGAPCFPQPDPNMKMPEVIERVDGTSIVYVDPSYHKEEIEREKNTAARVEEERQKEEDRKKAEESQKEKAEKTQDVATVVDKKAEGNKVGATKSIPRMNQSTDTIKQQPPQLARLVGNHNDAEEDLPISAHALSLVKGRPPSTCKAQVEVETTLSLRNVDDEIATATTGLQAATQLITKDALEAIPGPKHPNKAIKHWLPKGKRDGTKEEEEDGDDWTHISNESREATEVAPTAQADGRSIISRMFFG